MAETDMEEEEVIRDKMFELSNTKLEIQKAKDMSTQSWLDSKPLIDELQRHKLHLEKSKTQATETDAILFNVQSELDNVHGQIRDTNEAGRESNNIINETNQSLNQLQQETEQVKQLTDDEKRRRAKLKQTLRVKRQELRKTQLTLRAVKIETEAYIGSENEALKHVNRLETENRTVELSREDYDALSKRVKEETSLGEWRVLISMEQRLVAEASKEAAVKRLKEHYSEQRSKNKVLVEDDDVITTVVATESGSARGRNRNMDADSSWKREKARGGNGRRSSGDVKKRKSGSIFSKIKAFLCAENSDIV